MSNLRIPQDYKKKVQKSAFNLSTIKRTTLLPGQIIPIYSRRVMAGDKFILDINALLKSMPLSSPLYGTFKLQTVVFFDSDTNYYGYLDNNSKLSTQDLLAKKSHRYNFVQNLAQLPEVFDDANDVAESLYNGTWNNFRGSVLDYMGFPSGLVTASEYHTKGFNQPIDIGFILTYLNIFRNYYANKQSSRFPYIKGIDTQLHAVYDYYMPHLDELFMFLRNCKDGFDFGQTWQANMSISEEAYTFFQSYLTSLTNPYGGLLLTTYLPDLYRNLLDDTFNTTVSSVKTNGNSFTIDSLRFANKLQRLVDRFDVSGGRFSDWLRTVWGVSTRKDMDIPEIIGASQSLIDPSQVTAMAQTGKAGEEGSTDLGQFGGNFDNFNRQRKHSFVASTPGRVMVCVTLVPMVDYSQGIEPELLETNMADRYFPEFEQLGYQKVPQLWYQPSVDYKVHVQNNIYTASITSTSDPATTTIGKQIAWLPLMTDVNRCHGEFGNHGYYENWVLKRRWQQEFFERNADGSQDAYFTTRINQYVNPLDFQYPFLLRSITDPNWFLQMAIDVKAIRPKGKRFMPNLE